MNAKHGQKTSPRKMGPSSVQIAQGTLDNLKSPKDEVHTGPSSLLIRDTNIWTRNDIIRGSILIEDGRIQRIARRIPERAEAILQGGFHKRNCRRRGGRVHHRFGHAEYTATNRLCPASPREDTESF